MATSYLYVVSCFAIITASNLRFATSTVFNDCVEGSWGNECNETCNCSVLGTSTCDKVSGTCQCKSGWSGANCDKDVDECLQNTNICPSHSHCKNTYGGFDCLCDDGFSNSSNTCEDINECTSRSKNKCGIKISCVNTYGNYTCSCPEGQMLDSDGRSCNTCSDETWGIGCNRTCNCGVGTDYCDVKIGCVCKQGYTGTNCEKDINECIIGDFPCKFNENCVNLFGSVKCDCKPGYTRENGICNECKEGNWGYECNETCNCSELGTSTCDKVSGTCQCKSGWSGSNCDKDVDECLLNLYVCPSHSICKNNIGGYYCTCDDGFFMARNKCEDINECSLLVQICEQICINTAGSMNCSCRDGFSISPVDSTKCIATSSYDIQVVFNLTSEDLQLDNKKSTDYKKLTYEVESQMLKELAYANIKVIQLKVIDLRKGSLIADINIFIEENTKLEIELTTSLKKLENREVTLNDNPVSIRNIGLKDNAGSDSQQSIIGIKIGIPLGGGTFVISLSSLIWCYRKKKCCNKKNQDQQRSRNDFNSSCSIESDESNNYETHIQSVPQLGMIPVQNTSPSQLSIGSNQFQGMMFCGITLPNPNGGYTTDIYTHGRYNTCDSVL